MSALAGSQEESTAVEVCRGTTVAEEAASSAAEATAHLLATVLKASQVAHPHLMAARVALTAAAKDTTSASTILLEATEAAELAGLVAVATLAVAVQPMRVLILAAVAVRSAQLGILAIRAGISVQAISPSLFFIH